MVSLLSISFACCFASHFLFEEPENGSKFITKCRGSARCLKELAMVPPVQIFPGTKHSSAATAITYIRNLTVELQSNMKTGTVTFH